MVMVEYVSETLDLDSKKAMFSKICVFYTEFLKALYQQNGAVDL